jgi:predicted phage-related endonuclease
MKMDGISESYYMQMQHYLMVTGHSHGTFVCLNRDSGELIHFEVLPDYDVHKQILDECIKFWGYVQAGDIPLDPAPNAEIARIAKDNTDQSGEATDMGSNDKWIEAVADLMETKALLSEVEGMKEMQEKKVKELTGHIEVAQGGGYRVYYRTPKPSITIDREKLAKSYPQVYSDVCKLSAVSRRLVVYKS